MVTETEGQGTGEVVVKHTKVDSFSWEHQKGMIIVVFEDGRFHTATFPCNETWNFEQWITMGEISTFIQDKQASFNKEKENTNAR